MFKFVIITAIICIFFFAQHCQGFPSYLPVAEDADNNNDVIPVSEASAERSQAEESGNGGFKLNLLPAPAKTAESVNLEKEGIPSKILSTYDFGHKKIVDITHPIPIIDTISEHEKYGNNGDLFDGISRSLINGYEAFSNLLNKFIQAPKEAARTISRGITAQLDVIGGKLVGL